jgi:hypothetical protein
VLLWHPEHGFTDGNSETLGPLGWIDGATAHAQIQAAKAAKAAASQVTPDPTVLPASPAPVDAAPAKRGRPRKS